MTNKINNIMKTPQCGRAKEREKHNAVTQQAEWRKLARQQSASLAS